MSLFSFVTFFESRTSHEVRGLKYKSGDFYNFAVRRTSHEVRGLKYIVYGNRQLRGVSHLTRGAWIEIVFVLTF